MLQFIGPSVVLLAPFFQSYRINLPSSLSAIISRLSTLIPAHQCRLKYGYRPALSARPLLQKLRNKLRKFSSSLGPNTNR
jgi:hypothetical protein